MVLRGLTIASAVALTAAAIVAGGGRKDEDGERAGHATTAAAQPTAPVRGPPAPFRACGAPPGGYRVRAVGLRCPAARKVSTTSARSCVRGSQVVLWRFS
jgi:hypothetical protein